MQAAEQSKKTRGAGKRVSFQQEEAGGSQSKTCDSGGDCGDTRELESFSKVDKITGITPTGQRAGKGKTKYPQLPLVDTIDDALKNVQADREAVNEEIHEDPMELLSKDVPAEENLNGANKAVCSLDRISETDSQATISSVNAKAAACDQSFALTDSMPSEISNSQTSAREPQMRSSRKHAEKVKSAGRRG